MTSQVVRRLRESALKYCEKCRNGGLEETNGSSRNLQIDTEFTICAHAEVKGKSGWRGLFIEPNKAKLRLCWWEKSTFILMMPVESTICSSQTSPWNRSVEDAASPRSEAVISHPADSWQMWERMKERLSLSFQCGSSHGAVQSGFPRSRRVRAAPRGAHGLISHSLTAGQLNNLQAVLGLTRPGLCMQKKQNKQWLQGPFRGD